MVSVAWFAKSLFIDLSETEDSGYFVLCYTRLCFVVLCFGFNSRSMVIVFQFVTVENYDSDFSAVTGCDFVYSVGMGILNADFAIWSGWLPNRRCSLLHVA